MDSETLTIFVGVLLAVTLVAFLIQLPSGSLWFWLSLGFCFVAACVASVLLGTLIQWGRTASGGVYFSVFLLFFTIPALLSSAIAQVLLPVLRDVGVLRWYYILSVFIVGFIVVRYVAYFGRYEWQLISLRHGKVDILVDQPFSGIKPKHRNYRGNFARRFDLLDESRLKPSHYPGPDLDSFNTMIGLPKHLSVHAYVPATDSLYSINVELPERKIEKLSVWRWLYPLYRKQTHRFIELLVSDNGEVAVFVANELESKEVYRNMAKAISQEDLPEWAIEEFYRVRERRLSVEEPIHIAPVYPELKKKFRVRHELSGDLNSIVQLNAITANGERYLVDKEFWNGKALMRAHALPVHLRYITVNNEDNMVEWRYNFVLSEAAKRLKFHNIEARRNEVNELRYTFYLRLDENNKLLATSFEYVNGVKDEFKVDARLFEIEYY
jgi:hypothetical protein